MVEIIALDRVRRVPDESPIYGLKGASVSSKPQVLSDWSWRKKVRKATEPLNGTHKFTQVAIDSGSLLTATANNDDSLLH